MTIEEELEEATALLESWSYGGRPVEATDAFLASRADLARVTAERDEARHMYNDRWGQLQKEQSAHAETRKALEEKTVLLFNAEDSERTLRTELDAWTQNGFGARTPSEVQVFIEEGCRVEREVAEHNAKLLESTRAELATVTLERDDLQGEIVSERELCSEALRNQARFRNERDAARAELEARKTRAK